MRLAIVHGLRLPIDQADRDGAHSDRVAVLAFRPLADRRQNLRRIELRFAGITDVTGVGRFENNHPRSANRRQDAGEIFRNGIVHPGEQLAPVRGIEKTVSFGNGEFGKFTEVGFARSGDPVDRPGAIGQLRIFRVTGRKG